MADTKPKLHALLLHIDMERAPVLDLLQTLPHTRAAAPMPVRFRP